MKYTIPHTILGGTSFIIHEDYVKGVLYTAKHCQDIALLLTSVGEDGEWLPSKKEIREIKNIIDGEGVSLHVHLPTDGHCATEEDTESYYKKIIMAIERASILEAHTFVQHIDIIPLRYKNSLASKEQEECIMYMLERIARHLPHANMLALENLESFPVDFLDFCFRGTDYSRCLDIGHIWKDARDPLSIIPLYLEKTRLVHLHGLETRGSLKVDIENYKISPTAENVLSFYGEKVRDHKGLAFIPHAWLDDALHTLWKNNYNNVITLEIFDAEAFNISHKAVLASRARFDNKSSSYL